jgi:predicted secreted Zn-dependent protease
MRLMLTTMLASWIAIQGYNMPRTPPPTPRSEKVATPAPATALVLPPAVPAVPGKTLKDLPNTTIRYFDVTGKDLKAINNSLVAVQQADSPVRAAAPTTWAVDTTFKKTTTGEQCKVTDAKAAFSASVGLPRLVSDPAHKPELLAVWRAYVANMENSHAANLWFVYDRVGDIEKAILASTCEGARGVGTAAVERLKAQAAEFRRVNAAPAPAPAPAPAAK